MSTEKTWPADSYPTGVQLADWLERCTREERVAWAEVAVHDRQTVDRVQEMLLRSYRPLFVASLPADEVPAAGLIPDTMWVMPDESVTFGPTQPPEDLSAYQVPAPGKGRGATPTFEVIDEAWLFKGDDLSDLSVATAVPTDAEEAARYYRDLIANANPVPTRPVDQYTMCDLTADCPATSHDSRCLTTFGKVTLGDQPLQQHDVWTACPPDNPCRFCLIAASDGA